MLAIIIMHLLNLIDIVTSLATAQEILQVFPPCRCSGNLWTGKFGERVEYQAVYCQDQILK